VTRPSKFAPEFNARRSICIDPQKAGRSSMSSAELGHGYWDVP
jgi:hypothetical protein